VIFLFNVIACFSYPCTVCGAIAKDIEVALSGVFFGLILAGFDGADGFLNQVLQSSMCKGFKQIFT